MGETSILITPREVAAAMGGSAPPAVLDVRWSLSGPPGRDAYLRGHIPGAAFVDLDRDLASPPGREGRHPLPRPDDFINAMRHAGVSNARTVVVYDQSDGTSAARAWWLLRHYGHRDVRLLDGGFNAWVAEGGAVEDGSRGVMSGDFDGVPGAMPVVDARGAAAAAERGVLMDARAAARFRGDTEPVDPVAGHIPGAISVPTTANVTDEGRFLSPEQLRGRFESAGVRAGAEIATYCGSGVTAAHEIIALSLAGFTAALYPGSWSGWITDATRPVATGPE